MKIIANTGPGRMDWQEHPVPVPRAGQVRIRTAYCGICATDLLMIQGWPRTSFPAIPGHEWSGRVDAVGPGGDPGWLNRPCVADNLLSDQGEVGFEHPGGYAQYFITESDKIHFLPVGFPLDVATLIEPLAVTVRAFRRLGLADACATLIVGDGPIGLMMALMLRQAGVQSLCLVGGRPTRLAVAGKFGVKRVINYHELQGKLSPAAGAIPGRSFPCIIEASGSAAALSACLEMASPGAKVLVIGDYGPARAEFEWNHLLHRELEIIGSNASAMAWPEAVQRAVQWREELSSLITDTFPADQFRSALQNVTANRSSIKTVLDWNVITP